MAKDKNGIPLSEEELIATGIVFMIVSIFLLKNIYNILSDDITVTVFT